MTAQSPILGVKFSDAPMRLPDFILANTPLILAEWDNFARSVWPHISASPEDLRDHAEAILRATAQDMQSVQTDSQRSAKSKGMGQTFSSGLTSASENHAAGRAVSGFDLRAVVAEYRALRASVVRLWFESIPKPDKNHLDDLTRFHESMDQSLAEAVHRYSQDIDKSRQMFLGILGHDIRTPLNAISVSAELLAETRSEDQVCAEIASQIKSSTDAIGQMLSDFLDYAVSRLGRKMPITPVRMNLGALCREVIAEVRINAPGRSWQIEGVQDLQGDWDQGRIRQLLSNLICNAVQHGAENSEITVSISADNSRATVRVHNVGSPIPSRDLPRLFDPLVRGSNSNGRGGSVGLGLYIAREVAMAHGGVIEAESSVEWGTTFQVSLPLRCPALASIPN